MTSRRGKFYRNKMLARLSEAERDLLVPHLEPVDLPLRRPIEEYGKSIRYAYFPEDGIISVVARTGQTVPGLKQESLAMKD